MTISPERQNEILQRIGILILDEAGDDWQEITVRYSCLSTTSTTRTIITTKNGETRRGDIPLKASTLFYELRREMHEDEKGTWYIADYKITRPGSFSVDFDYESEPQFAFEVDPRTYYEDLEYFPRPFETVPEWMQGKLVRALEMIKREEGNN
ncbi:immunity protein YezG family protein [Nocardiopsis sp. FR26]|uniref:immunity protein YezG family protein n=1 Tax=Nocardiopsis sp. FR26 TaxID=2605987 RepID=UPI00135BA4C1|nr:immunity protein YezG family protein [Nocardiopsis sp. FR26]